MDNNYNNKENENDELLPKPEFTEPESLNNGNLPVPEFEEDFLPDITIEQAYEELLGTDENGYTRCSVMANLSKIKDLETLKNATSNSNGKDLDEVMETIAEIDVERCFVREYTLDGENINLELEFDNPLDSYMQEFLRILDEYRDETAKYDKEVLEGKDVAYPLFSINFSPFAYPGQAVFTYSQPYAYFKTLAHDNEDHRIVHLIFNKDDVTVKTFKVKKDEMLQMQEYALAMERQKAGL